MVLLALTYRMSRAFVIIINRSSNFYHQYNYECKYAYRKYSKDVAKNNKNESKINITDSKIRIISHLNFESKEDARPFHELPVKTLLHIYKMTKKDEECGFCKNRLYYLASRVVNVTLEHKMDQRSVSIGNLAAYCQDGSSTYGLCRRASSVFFLSCPPSVLSTLLAKRTFVYRLSFEWLEKSLNVLQDHKVPSDRILRDLWVLKYHSKTIEERFSRVRESGLDSYYPWMVRCSEEFLKRFIATCQEIKNILKETKSTKNYLAQRLNTEPEVIDEIFLKVPTLKCIRVTKVKNFMDFLIKEGFDVEDIASKPRILAASQKTVSKRLQKLRDLGLSKINLNVLCRSKKDFKKFYDTMSSNNSQSQIK